MTKGFETVVATIGASDSQDEVANQEMLNRAKGYPYSRPQSSFVYINGHAYEFDDSQWQGPAEFEHLQTCARARRHRCSMQEALEENMTEWVLPGRGAELTLVLAVGSNAAPAQLAGKFTLDHFPHGVVIPVLRCILPDFDVVYAPAITSYGSCPATLEHSPGTAVAIFVTYLRPELLRRMHATEGVHMKPPAYNFCHLTEVKLHVGLGLQDYRNGKMSRKHTVNNVYQYNHHHGSLHLPVQGFAQNIPIAIQEIEAVNRSVPALEQTQMQLACKHVLAQIMASNDSHKAVLTPLQMPAAQANPHSLIGDIHQDTMSQTVSQLAGDQPEWLHNTDSLDRWILSNLNDRAWRLKMAKALQSLASPFVYNACTIQTPS